MQQVKGVELRNFRHARRQRQIIRRIVEQGIPRDLDFVVMNVRFLAPESDRLRVRNEMDFMRRVGELQSQLSGYNTATAVRRITGDPNFHVRALAASVIRWLE